MGLSKCVSIGYTRRMVAKDAGLRIRIDRDLRDAFQKVCRAEDKPAAQVIRELMRDYISRASQGEALNVPERDQRGGLQLNEFRGKKDH